MNNKKQMILNDSILNMAVDLPLTQIANLYGVSRQYVYALCSKNGLKSYSNNTSLIISKHDLMSVLFSEVQQ